MFVSAFRYFKFTDSSCFGREDYTYFEKLPVIRFVWAGISLIFYLLQSFVGCAIQFKICPDEIVVIDNSGYYHFNREADISNNGVLLLNTIWAEMVHIISHYFPILFLLTAPFLSFSLKLVQRKSKIPGINHFIFALHYTAFLEFLMITKLLVCLMRNTMPKSLASKLRLV